MGLGVIDAGVALGWIQGRPRSLDRLERLLRASREGRSPLVISIVNVAEVLRHAADPSRATGVDPFVLLKGHGVQVH